MMIASDDGTRLATQIQGQSVVQCWNADTLELVKSLEVPDQFSIYLFSPDNSHLFLDDKNNNVQIVKISNGKVNGELPCVPDADWGKSEVRPFTFDGKYFNQVLFHKGAFNVTTRMYDWKNKTVHKNENFLSPMSIFPDYSRQTAAFSEIRDINTDRTLFDFSSISKSGIWVSCVVPDNIHVVTRNKKKEVQLWRRVRPEWWWGYFYLPEMWLCILFGIATLVSLFKTSKPRTA